MANHNEAAIVRLIFARYAELGRFANVKVELEARDIVSKALLRYRR